MTEIMSVPEFKSGMKKLADAECFPRVHAWKIINAYMDADDDAKRDCSQMLRDDLADLDTVARQQET